MRTQKNLFFLFFSIFVFLFKTNAQVFSGGSGPISDNGVPTNFFIPVSGLNPSSIDTNFGLKRICITIHHPNAGQLGVFLSSPSGTTTELTSGNGGNNPNYTNTCFEMTASQLIGAASAPFTGIFYPEHNFGNVNNGQNGNGVWRISILDVIPGNVGNLISCSLEFDSAAPKPTVVQIGPCDDFVSTLCACPPGTPLPCKLLPDVFVASSFLSDTFYNEEEPGWYYTSNSTANIGWGPIELVGTQQWFCGDSQVSGSVLCPNGEWSKQKVNQRVYIKTSNNYFDYMDTLVGFMSFHSELGHQHLHMEKWVQNTIRIKGPETDARMWPIVGVGNKVSFCVYDHVKCDNIFNSCKLFNQTYTFNALPNRGLGIGYDQCGEDMQGISVGYSDIYDLNLPGQEIKLDTLCNGDYFLVSVFDPDDRILESNKLNNQTIIPITLTKQLENCCSAFFETDTTLDSLGIYRFIDRSKAMPKSWWWSFGDGETDTIQFPSHQFDSSGIYEVVLITETAQGCIDTFTQFISVELPVSLKENSPFFIKVYPNPASAKCIVYNSFSKQNETYLRLFNSNGMLLWSSKSKKNQTEVPLIEKGILLLQLITEKETKTIKIISQ